MEPKGASTMAQLRPLSYTLSNVSRLHHMSCCHHKHCIVSIVGSVTEPSVAVPSPAHSCVYVASPLLCSDNSASDFECKRDAAVDLISTRLPCSKWRLEQVEALVSTASLPEGAQHQQQLHSTAVKLLRVVTVVLQNVLQAADTAQAADDGSEKAMQPTFLCKLQFEVCTSLVSHVSLLDGQQCCTCR